MRFARLTLGVCLAVSGLTVASGATGQTANDPGMTPEDMAKGRQKREVRIEAVADVTHDTNVARANAAQAARLGIVREDTIYTPTVRADLVLPVGQQAVFLRGNASYLFHDRNDQLDHSLVDAVGGVGLKAGPCNTVLSTGYARGRTQIDDRVLANTVTNILEVERVNAAVECATPTGLGVFAAAGRSWGHNSEARTSLNDAETTTASGGLSFGRPSAGQISIVGSYAQTDYSNRPLVNGDKEGYELTSGGIMLERRVGGRIEASATVTYSQVNLTTPAPPPGVATTLASEFEGLTYSVNVSYRASSQLRGQVEFERSVQPTLIQGQSYEVQTNYVASLSYRFGSRASLLLSAAQRETDARGETIIAGPPRLTDARTRLLSAELKYRQSRRLTIALRGEHANRDTNDPLFDYTSDRVGIAATFTY